MEQSALHASSPQASPLLAATTGGSPSVAAPTSAAGSDEERAFAAVVASVERLDELGLVTEAGLATVEPATTFGLD